MVAILITVLGGLRADAPVTSLIALCEIEVLAYTVLVLLLLSLFGSQSFSQDAKRIVRSFEAQSQALLDKSQEHWAEQSRVLTVATTALNQVVEVEGLQLALTREVLKLTKDMLDLERGREQLRIEQASLRKQRIRPAVAVQPYIIHPGLVAKRIGVHVLNQGEDGRRVRAVLRCGGTHALAV